MLSKDVLLKVLASLTESEARTVWRALGAHVEATRDPAADAVLAKLDEVVGRDARKRRDPTARPPRPAPPPTPPGPARIKVKNEQGESRIYLDGAHVGRVSTWCPPLSERNKGARRQAKVTLLDGRTFDFPGEYRDVVMRWVRAGSWVAAEAPAPKRASTLTTEEVKTMRSVYTEAQTDGCFDWKERNGMDIRADVPRDRQGEYEAHGHAAAIEAVLAWVQRAKIATFDGTLDEALAIIDSTVSHHGA